MLKSLLFGLVVAGLMVCSANAGIIFEDNFNSYAYDNSHLSDQSTVWQGVGNRHCKIRVMAQWSGIFQQRQLWRYCHEVILCRC